MKFFVKTYGCTLNQADSIIMTNLLLESGHKLVSEEKSDLIIVNSCTVKGPTQNKIIRYIQDNKNKKIIIAGCLAKTNYIQLTKLFNFPIIGCDNIFDINNVVKGLIKNSIESKFISKVNLVPIQKNKVIEIIPICQGCLGNCSYCATRFARGKLYSYKIKDILSHVRNALKRGVKEFHFTAQDTGAYGQDIKKSIVDLLEKVVKVRGSFKIRIGMMNPQYAIKYKKKLVKLLKNPKVFKFLHLPMQSGSDKILKLMNRKYTSKQYLDLISYLKKNIPNLTISTDVIVAFPNETKKDYQLTKKLIKLVQPDVINVSKFWKRPGTPASSMKQVRLETAKNRAKELVEIHKKISSKINKSYIGKEMQVLVDEIGKGRTSNYKIVKIKAKLGQTKIVKIKKANRTSLVL